MKPFGQDFVESCAYSESFVKLKKHEFELEGKPRKGRPQEFGSDNLHVLLDYDYIQSKLELAETFGAYQLKIIRYLQSIANIQNAGKWVPRELLV